MINLELGQLYGMSSKKELMNAISDLKSRGMSDDDIQVILDRSKTEIKSLDYGLEDVELVIKIPAAIYKMSQLLDVKYKDVIQIPLENIVNATPLPKGHGDLIDASNLLTITEYDGENEITYVPYDEIKNASVIVKAESKEMKND